MKYVCLKIYTYEKQKHKGILLYDWLLKLAKKNNIAGGNVFRAIAGYGHFGKIQEEHFFELASNVPVKISFIMKKEKVNSFLKLIKDEEIDLFYATTEVEYGRTNES
ncbi:MAG: hypothetical protein KR126chlam5_00169 [Candidatus Anoxychlamydiales bacterium]|nr:hypothetical protein [Candidatus Anoxychlamydiales bacterium]